MPAVPLTLGPFRLTGRLHGSAAGEVHSAVDDQGRSATVVVLAPGPATDAAARDRFAAAVASAARQREVLLDASGATRPWAALSGGASASAVLAAVLPLVAPVEARGPAFEPYWRDRPGAWQPRAPAAAPVSVADGGGGASTAKWVLAAAASAVVLVLAGLLGWRMLLDGNEDGARAAPAPESTSVLPTQPSVPEQQPQQPQPDPDPEQQPEATGSPPDPPGDGGQGGGQDGGQGGGESQAPPQRPLETTGPGVAGPSFTPDDETKVMELAGLPFPFRVPPGWECERSEDVPEPVARYRCEDRSGRSEEPAGGVIEVAPCPQPCGTDAWTVLLARYASLAQWRPVDATTAVIEDEPAEPPGRYRIRMSRIFSTVPGASPDAHVYVEMAGGPEDVETVQKIVNDVRANTS